MSMKSWMGLCAVVVVAGCAQGPGASSTPEPQPRVTDKVGALSFASTEADMVRGARIERINLAHARELWVRVGVEDLNRTAEVTVKMVNPFGEFMWADRKLFSADPKIKSAPGMGSDIDVMQAKAIQGGYALDFVIPVAGTRLNTVPAPGTWKVEALVQGRAEPISAPLEVVHQFKHE